MPPTQPEIASAKAEIAVLISKQFQDDITQLRDALDSANQLAALLKAENATLKAALKDAVEGYDFDAIIPPITRARNGGDGVPERERSGLQRPPPEGTIFSNGGAYGPKRDNKQLMKELNRWTQAHGYKAKIYHNKVSGTKGKLTISCVLSGRPKKGLAARRETAEQEAEMARAMGWQVFVIPDAHPSPGQAPQQQQIQPEGQPVGDPQVPAKKPRKKMTPRRSDCPLRFYLQELVAGSGTYVVKHSELPSQQRCNHEPQVKFVADAEASGRSTGSGHGQEEEQELDTDADAEEDESEIEE
ncbi:hypothetical protein Daus18300_014122 [Diaporthe australafricana]|uniref:DRBM domain-containing protein n=1 Tax=Diaporthe australafricana TaxID=127596 RepID=A0ABR3VWI7_9PEZI